MWVPDIPEPETSGQNVTYLVERFPHCRRTDIMFLNSTQSAMSRLSFSRRLMCILYTALNETIAARCTGRNISSCCQKLLRPSETLGYIPVNAGWSFKTSSRPLISQGTSSAKLASPASIACMAPEASSAILVGSA